MKAYYFSPEDKRLPHGDGRLCEIGATHTVEPPIVPCERGLHGSERILDALQYASSSMLWEVELNGVIVAHRGGDKHAASMRTYRRGGVDLSATLHAFARWCALSVADQWDMPDIVRQYLETGDESLREAAHSSAYSAANAAYSAAHSAANAAYSAAHSAAYYAAYYAANAALAASLAAAKDAQEAKLREMVEAAWAERGL